MKTSLFRSLNILFISIFFIACSSTYFAALEKIGIEKRELMVSRIEAATESQKEAKEQFKDALEEYRTLLNSPNSELSRVYSRLSDVLEETESRAKDVSNRIDSVESVSDALFDEWQDELDQYENKNFRRSSERKLKASQRKYNTMIAAMKRAESKLDPALQPLRDSVLYLKHNLNAESVGGLDAELASIEAQVDSLLKDLSDSVREADEYVAELNR